MKASIHQAGLISSLKQGQTNGRNWITFALSTAHSQSSVTYHNYIMGGKLADFWFGRIVEGDLVTVEGSAVQKTGSDNRKWLNWSVENFNFEGVGLPDQSFQFCEVTLKGMVKQLRQAKGFVTFGCGCKPYTSKELIFFNVSMGEKLFNLYPVKVDDKVLLKVHMEPRKKGSETYYNWYIDKIVKLGHGFIKAREPVDNNAMVSMSPAPNNPAFGNENPNPFS